MTYSELKIMLQAEAVKRGMRLVEGFSHYQDEKVIGCQSTDDKTDRNCGIYFDPVGVFGFGPNAVIFSPGRGPAYFEKVN